MFTSDKEILNLINNSAVSLTDLDLNYIRTASIDLKVSNIVSKSKENTGIEINSDSTYDDIKTSGFLPFIIRNESNFNFSFKEGDRLCQLILAKTTEVERKYGQRPDSKYIDNSSLLSRYDSDKIKK